MTDRKTDIEIGGISKIIWSVKKLKNSFFGLLMLFQLFSVKLNVPKNYYGALSSKIIPSSKIRY